MPALRSLAVALALTALTAGVRAVTVEADPPEAGIVRVSSETPADGGSRVTLQARACPGFLFLYWSADQSATYDNFMLSRTTAVAPAGTAFLAHFVEHDGLRDGDADGIPDDWEEAYAAPPLGVDHASRDSDQDGLSALQEARYLCDPRDRDTDGDTLPDGWEAAIGLDPTDAADAADDLDGDGVPNRLEFTRIDVFDTITLSPGWNAVSVWNAGPIQFSPAGCAAAVYRWDAAAQRFVPATDLSRVSPGDALLVYRRQTTSFSSLIGVSCWEGAPVVYVQVHPYVFVRWYWLSVSAFPSYAGSVAPRSATTDSLAPRPINISAVPAHGYRFLFWTATPAAHLADPLAAATQVLLSGDASATANFRPHEGLQDFDQDRMLDGWETAYGLDPLDPADAQTDADGDGLDNLDEQRHGTNPLAPDSDGDGISDGAEVAAALDPLSAADAALDADGDGLSSLDEFRLGRPLDGKLLYPGWNLVSLARPAALSSAMAVGPVYRLDAATQSSVEMAPGGVLNPSFGYWIFCGTLAELDIHGGRIVELRRDMLGSRLERTALRQRFERVAHARRITARGWLTPRAPRGVR